jgi:formylglycine-generating enzyme required for sulfatase activity
MASPPTHRLALLALFCLLVLTGCKDAEKEQAVADAEAARTALAEGKTQLDGVKTKLEATRKERDGLKTNVSDLSASLENVKAMLAAVTQAHDQLQAAAEQVTTLKDQLTQLARDRDSTLAKAADAQGMAEKLKSQLQEQIQKVAALQEQNNSLQQLIDDLKKLVLAVSEANTSGGGAAVPTTAIVAPGATDAGRPTPPAGAGPTLTGKTIDLGNGVSMEFVLVPAGSFDMGSPDSEKERDSDEGPVHRVQITKAFYMSKYEVTQDQYLAIMGRNPSKFSGGNLPVEAVSWDEAVACCGKIGGRLPTEAEWEYACRAGSETRFCYGDDLTYAQLGEYAWYSGNSGSTTHTIGQKKPNSFGLYDMHGNVYEWCSDWFAAYANAQTVNPVGASSGQYRVCRGGSWFSDARRCRSANRNYISPDYRDNNIGFRVALDSN